MATARRLRLGVVLIAAIFSPSPAVSEPLSAASGDDREEAEGDRDARTDLLSVIGDVSALATKTRLNADYVPGILSVLNGDELVALGARTVWEALELVPGVQIERNNNGGRRVAIRGFQHSNGNVKLLLNSVAMNNAFAGYSNILYIPIEQVERIEVIRGPGSAVHGEYAFAGVINVITRQNENRAYVHAGSGDTYGTGAVLSARSPDGDWRLNLNASGWDQQGTEITAGPDRLHVLGQRELSQAPGRINNAENHRLAVFALDYKKLSMLAQYSRNQGGTFFGALNVLPEPNTGANASQAEQSLIQVRRTFDPLPTLSTEFKLTWSEYTGNWSVDVLPSGVAFPLGSQNVYPDGVFIEDYVRTTRREAELDLDWSGWSGHRWQLSLSSAEMRIDDAWWVFNGDVETLEPLPTVRRYSGDRNYLQEGARRSIHSLALQDQFRLLGPLAVTAGLRYDRYSDVGDNLSPRLAAVWTLSDEHLLKAQYAEAFFPPTLYQLYGNARSGVRDTFSLDPETVATTELGYIFRRGTSVARATLYHSRVRDLIVLENSRYDNRGRVRLRGVEAEWEQRLSPTWKLTANLSYGDTLDEETGGPLVGAADWLGNLGLLYRPRPDILLSGHWRVVGDRHRSADDPRDDRLPGYQDLSLTLNWFDVGTPGLTLRAGVDNLLGQQIKSPAAAYTYTDDYLRLEERTWWIQISYQWR
ncbi:TonB-dependent receptor plug domain-containing protein [Allochromatium tepidum]|uniref:Outer membrane receptor FepA n=1 Tax=Allochromatium tepidum TaxID=553982 RepID=A0ABM7QJ00_9GAMM|nr:TonB-dependent receptor [Allochromatium tepidum]BCU05718.1 outer membrane receptor FepA [Allochromatium tepidum]